MKIPKIEKLETIKTSDLLPYARNAKLHPDSQVNQIAASIKQFGFIVPVLIDKENTIVAGHGRVLAAQKLKLDTLPCTRAEHLSESQIKAFRLIDNKIAESGFDDELLNLELGDLKTDFAMDDFGFEFGSLDKADPGAWNPPKTDEAELGDGISELVGYGLQSFWKDIKNENARAFDYKLDLPVESNKGVVVGNKYSQTNLEEIQRIILTYMREGDYFLENCCGWSSFGYSAKLFGYSGIGVDIWETALKHSKKQIAAIKNNAKVEILEMNGMELKFDDNKFDFVYCNPPFMDQEKYSGGENDIADKNIDKFGGKFVDLMRENYRVLKPGNLCVVTINDKREKGVLVPLQARVIEWGEVAGFKLHDFVVVEVLSQRIRLRKKEYEQKRTVKCHEYIIVFKKC